MSINLREYLAPDQAPIDFECTICYEALNTNDAVECLECEKHVCKKCYMKIDNKCPTC